MYKAVNNNKQRITVYFKNLVEEMKRYAEQYNRPLQIQNDYVLCFR